MQNALSIDVEEWFCANNFSAVIPRGRWRECRSRVEGDLRFVLSLLKKRRTKATFFVLGWVAEHFPGAVSEIAREGHELATHGYSHQMVTKLTPEEFEADLSRSLEILRGLSREPVIGFRAPSFTIVKNTLWALPILERHGIRYDSSIFPVAWHPDYGIADAPRAPYAITSGLWEFPPTVWRCLSTNIPVAGGAYFRLLPYAVTRYGLRQQVSAGHPLMCYLHTWEFDAHQPRVRLPWGKRLRHYTNLARTAARLRCLLRDFRFTTAREALQL